MNRLYAALLVLLELLWTYAIIVALTEWGWIGWERPPISLPAATLLAAAALAPAILPDKSESIFVRLRGAILPLQVLLLAFIVRTQTAAGYDLLDFDWFIALWDAPQLFLGAVAYGTFLLWRAGTATAPLPVPERLHTRFLLGLAILFITLLFAFFADDDADSRSPLLSLAIYSVTYFGAGMAAIAVANLRDIRREMVRRSDTGLPSFREWMAVPLATIVGMLFTSLVFSAFFSFDLARLLLIPLEYLARGIAIAILYGIIWPLSFVAGALTWFLEWIGGTVQQEEEQNAEGPQLTDDPLLVEQGETVLFSETALLVLQWGLGILAAIVVILILAKALNRFRRDTDAGEEEVTESLDPWSNFKHDLNLFMGWLLSLVRRKPRPVPIDLPTPVAVTGDTGGEAREFTIREIYQGLLWEGRAAGRPRRDAETPFEYGTRIHPLDTTEEHALEEITQAYVQARYGASDPAPDRLRWLNRQWLRLRAAMTRPDETA